MSKHSQDRGHVAQRGVNLILTAVIALAFIGFFIGIDYGVPRQDPQDDPVETGGVPTASTAIPATSYLEMRDVRLSRVGDTEQWQDAMNDLLRSDPSLDTKFTPDPRQKRQSLALRSERRAFNGAPPVVPHSVEQLGADACLLCHGAGFEIQNRTARQLPHPYLENCLQCHTPPTPTLLKDTPMLADNSFDGIAAPFEGERAWPGAPPTIPHTTWMRNDCLACHGPNGWPGMETTHPNQVNCLQCHAPSSMLDHLPATLNQLELVPPLPIVDE